VSDHHYWPGHLENWGNGSQITSKTDRRMPDLAEVLNEEQPGLSIHDSRSPIQPQIRHHSSLGYFRRPRFGSSAALADASAATSY
jgi:hypothetical protein